MFTYVSTLIIYLPNTHNVFIFIAKLFIISIAEHIHTCNLEGVTASYQLTRDSHDTYIHTRMYAHVHSGPRRWSIYMLGVLDRVSHPLKYIVNGRCAHARGEEMIVYLHMTKKHRLCLCIIQDAFFSENSY